MDHPGAWPTLCSGGDQLETLLGVVQHGLVEVRPEPGAALQREQIGEAHARLDARRGEAREARHHQDLAQRVEMDHRERHCAQDGAQAAPGFPEVGLAAVQALHGCTEATGQSLALHGVPGDASEHARVEVRPDQTVLRPERHRGVRELGVVLPSDEHDGQVRGDREQFLEVAELRGVRPLEVHHDEAGRRPIDVRQGLHQVRHGSHLQGEVMTSGERVLDPRGGGLHDQDSAGAFFGHGGNLVAPRVGSGVEFLARNFVNRLDAAGRRRIMRVLIVVSAVGRAGRTSEDSGGGSDPAEPLAEVFLVPELDGPHAAATFESTFTPTHFEDHAVVRTDLSDPRVWASVPTPADLR